MASLVDRPAHGGYPGAVEVSRPPQRPYKWECTRCTHKMRDNLRYCPSCGYTVYRPLY